MRELLSALLVFLLATAVPAQDWSKIRIKVTPGHGAGSLLLGKPIPEAARKTLGLTNEEVPAEDGPGSGLVLWGKESSRRFLQGILVRLDDGKSRAHIHSIELKGVRALTDQGVYLGAPATAVAARYPEAQRDYDPVEQREEWYLEGLVLRMSRGRVAEMIVEPGNARPWRFTPLTVWPGKSAGPIELGKPLSKEVYRALGEPTYRRDATAGQGSGLVRWSLPGPQPARKVEAILHDGRNPQSVLAVRVKGVRAMTDRKVRLGDPVAAVRRAYPDGKLGLHEQYDTDVWKIPGLNFLLRDDRVEELFVYTAGKGEGF
ncbi:MAG: hypothetical protein HY319_20280 [Armatimonadetes bacterium]|nr:hypothetical protein [Armatimonadota bacterium]